jgi:hypothetical protein
MKNFLPVDHWYLLWVLAGEQPPNLLLAEKDLESCQFVMPYGRRKESASVLSYLQFGRFRGARLDQ